jgi:hypothetical protein
MEIRHVWAEIREIDDRIVGRPLEPGVRCVLEEKAERKKKLRTQIEIPAEPLLSPIQLHRSAVEIGRV